MTENERIEAAAKDLCIHEWDKLPEVADLMEGLGSIAEGKEFWRSKARKALTAAFPELFPPAGQEPTHWIAPWEAGDDEKVAMIEAVLHVNAGRPKVPEPNQFQRGAEFGMNILDGYQMTAAWRAARTAYLNTKDKP